MEAPPPNPSPVACPECDLLHGAVALPKGAVARCRRCSALLERKRPGGLQAPLALYLTALCCFLLANAYPLLALNLHGATQDASLPRCAQLLSAEGWPWLAAVLITTVILAPLAHILGMILVISRLLLGQRGPGTALGFRLVEAFRSWGMAEVFVLGLVIAYVKLAQWAVVVPGPSLYALGAFMLATAAAGACLDPQEVWNRVQAPTPVAIPPGALTAKAAGLVACPTCQLLSPMAGPGACPRCGASLHSRKPNSRQRSWSLLLTAAVLYLPANLLPVMRMVNVGHLEADTILGGLIRFAADGSWGLALVIFVASVLVPVLKLAALALLLLTEGSRWRPVHRARLYRLMEWVGRWSMVDIFVVTLMVALVELGGLATVAPGPGSVAFALVVITGMLAVQSFDPRLVWDALESDHD